MRVLVLILLLIVGLRAEEAYTFTLDGHPIRPLICHLGGPGDRVLLDDYCLALGPPGRYDYVSKNGALYLRGQLVAARTEQNPRITPQLQCLYTEFWNPQLASRLKGADLGKLCLVVSGSMELQGKLPNLPEGLRYLMLTQVVSPSLTDYSSLKRLKNLRFLAFERFELDAGLIAQNKELRYLQGSDLIHPERLAALTQLRVLNLSANSELQNIAFAGKLRQLEELNLSFTPVNDLGPLAGLGRLRLVKANSSGVAALPAGNLPALRELSLMGAPLEDATLSAFEQANPECLVRHHWKPELTRATRGVDRVRVRSGGTCHREVASEVTLAEVTDPAQVDELMAMIDIDEAQSKGVCMCCGGPSIELYREGKEVLTLGMQHGAALRWEGWPADARLTADSGSRLNDWLAARGVSGPRDEVAATKARADEFQLAFSEATSGLSEGVKKALLTQDPFEESSSTLPGALKAQFPDSERQIDAMFRVLGKDGPWNPSSMYEVAAEKQLESYPVELLKARTELALSGEDPRLARGAIRLLLFYQSPLGDWGPPEAAVEAAVARLQDSRSPYLRRQALSAMLAWKGLTAQQAEHHLRVGLSDPDLTVRRQAMLVAGRARLPGMAEPLLAVVDGKPPVVLPRDSQPEPGEEVGGPLTDWELAALSLGLMKEASLPAHLEPHPLSPAARVARALLGESELLEAGQFHGTRSYVLQLTAVAAVARCKGRHGLPFVLDYQTAEFGWEEETVVGMIKTMLLEENAPGRARLEKVESLADLKAWYQESGPEYLARFK